MATGVDYCETVKTTNKVFCPVTFKNLRKDWPGGSYLLMKSTPKVLCGIPLLAIGYKYNSRKVLVFIGTEGGWKY